MEYADGFAGLIGVGNNNANWFSGNPLLETGTAYVFMKRLGLLASSDSNALAAAFARCLPDDGFFYKTPGGKENVSHDDVIGVVAGYATCGGICSGFLEGDVIAYGKAKKWVFSSSGKFYWDALTKPWHYAYYMLAAEHNPGLLAKLSLLGFTMFDALFNKKNSSDKKLLWLMLEVIKGKSFLVDLGARFWHKRLVNTWGGVNAVFKAYYGPNHIFTVYSWNF